MEELLIKFCNFENQCKVGGRGPKEGGQQFFGVAVVFVPDCHYTVGGVGGIMSRNLEAHFHPHLAPRATVG